MTTITKLTALFMFEKETKGTARYEEVASEGNNAPFIPIIGSLYVKKTALNGGGIPKALRVDITVT